MLYLVKTVFANVAANYDLMNDAMSFGLHRLWKQYFADELRLRFDTKVVDVAGGTGDIAFRLFKRLHERHPTVSAEWSVTIVDVNEKMLDVGKVGQKRDYRYSREYL